MRPRRTDSQQTCAAGSNERELPTVESSKRTFAGKPNPMAMAQAMVLLPVPFGPMIMLRAGPGRNSTLSYVRKEWHAIRTMDPVT